jgi:hypothetical protein
MVECVPSRQSPASSQGDVNADSPTLLALAPRLHGDGTGQVAALTGVAAPRIPLHRPPPEALAALAGDHAVVGAAGPVPAHRTQAAASPITGGLPTLGRRRHAVVPPAGDIVALWRRSQEAATEIRGILLHNPVQQPG